MTQDKPTPARGPGFYLYCDKDTRDGAWTVVEVEADGSVGVLGSDRPWRLHQLQGGAWGDRIPTPAAPAKTDKLLALARKCDETADLEAKIVAGEELRSLLGDRYEEFDKRYEELCAAEASGLPVFPWKAECVAVHLGLVPRSEAMKQRLRAHTNKAGLVLLAGMAETPAQHAFVERWQALSDSALMAEPLLSAHVVEMQRTFLVGQVPAETVAGWLEVAREALRWSEPADLPIDAESNLRAVLQRLAQMMQERLPAQARAE